MESGWAEAYLLELIILPLIFFTESQAEINHQHVKPADYFVGPLTVDFSGKIEYTAWDEPSYMVRWVMEAHKPLDRQVTERGY